MGLLYQKVVDKMISSTVSGLMAHQGNGLSVSDANVRPALPRIGPVLACCLPEFVYGHNVYRVGHLF